MVEVKGSRTANEARDFAQKALLDAIHEGVEEIRASEDYSISAQAASLKALAYAFRLAVGGPQPGSVEVAK